MPALNPHVFPLVPTAGLAPELAARAGMGGWEPYSLAAPLDRLLPFTLARVLLPSASPWLNCASVVHAETGELVFALTPLGSTVSPVPDFGLVLTRFVDTASQTEYYTYDGALIPGLFLPCGIPLRLIVENAYQSPRFLAVAKAADLPLTHQKLEWWHSSPLGHVPYGQGLRQRLYVANGALSELPAREEEQSSKNLDSGKVRRTYYAAFAQQQLVVDPAPAYLAQALQAARSCKFFEADGERSRLLAVKPTPAGPDGGRYSLTATLESYEPILSRGCDGQLPEVAFDPAYTPRGWRCGDPNDKAPDVQPTGAYSCEVSGGAQTGYVLREMRDMNPFSPSYNKVTQTRTQDTALCPAATLYSSAAVTVYATKNDCASGSGSRVGYTIQAGAYKAATQQEADAQALAAANAGAQANANATGTCQTARRLYLTNIEPKTKVVAFTLARSDSQGDVTANIIAQATVSLAGGGGTETKQYSRPYTLLADGVPQLDFTLGFGGDVLLEFHSLEIVQASPADYQF